MYNKYSINKAPLAWKLLSPFATICLLMVALVLFTDARGQEAASQEPGAVTGQVINKATKRTLINVSIKVVDTPISTTTDQDGNYTIRNLAPGPQALIFEYTGLDTMRIPVHVEAGKTITRDIEMTSDVYVLDTFVVASDREGQAQAIQQQKMAVDSRYVLAADSFGEIQSGNIGDLLKQVPGIMVFDSVTAGEGAGAPGELTSFRVRGAMDDQSALVTMNGNEASSAGAIGEASRNFSLRNFNTDQVESVEVFKAATPAHPGNTLGGLVNFTTRSAFNQKGRRLTLNGSMTFLDGYFGIGSRQHGNLEPTRQFYPGISLSYSEAFFHRTPHPVGISLSVGSRRSARYGIRLEAQYSDPYNELPWPQDISDAKPGARGYRWQDEDQVVDSLNASLTLDFKISRNTTAYIITGWERDKQIDGGFRRLRADASTILPGSTMDRIEATEAAGVYLQSSIALYRYTSETFRINPGVKHTWGDLSLTYDAFYSKSTLDRNEKRVEYYLGSPTSDISGNAASRVKYVIEGINTNAEDGATLSIISGADPGEGDSWGNLSFAFRPDAQEDKRYGGKIDAKKSLLFRFPIQLQAGAAYNVRETAYDRPEYLYDFTGVDKLLGTPDDPKLGSFLDRNRGSDGFYYGNRLPTIAWISPDVIWDYFQAYPEEFWGRHGYNAQAVMQNKKSFKEEITAIYFMGTWKISDLTILAGARWERTDNSTLGYMRMSEAGSSSDPTYEPDAAERAMGRWKAASGQKSYDSWLPGVHLRYEPVKNFVLRASLTNNIGRPSVSNMIVGAGSLTAQNELAQVDHQNRTVRISNPDLVPQTGRNVDVSIEYYLKDGAITLSGFHKNEHNRIETVQSKVGEGMDNGFEGMYENYDLFTTQNETQVKIQGLELAFRQRLYYLPWKLQNLNLSLNYSYNESKRTRTMTRVWVDTKDLGSPRDTANAQLFYNGRAIEWRVKANWRGAWQSASARYWGLSTVPREAFKYDETLRVDLSATWKINRTWRAFCHWDNVTGEAQIQRAGFSDAFLIYSRGFSNISAGVRAEF